MTTSSRSYVNLWMEALCDGHPDNSCDHNHCNSGDFPCDLS